MEIKRILKSRWFLGAVCLLFSLLALAGYTASVNSKNETARVAVFVNDVKKGAVIAEGDVKTLEVGRLNLSDSFLRDPEEVVGKYALTDCRKEEYIQKEKIGESFGGYEKQLLELDGRRQAISVSVDFPGSVSDKVAAGDIVSCIVVTDEGAAIPPELTYVELLTATTINGSDHENPDDQLEDNLSTATLLVTPRQATRLAAYSKNAYIHLSLVYRGDSAVKEQFLTRQEEALAGLPADAEPTDAVSRGTPEKTPDKKEGAAQ